VIEMPEKIAAGNWKMNKTLSEGVEEMNQLIHLIQSQDTIKADKVIVATSFIHLEALSKMSANLPNVIIAAQNCSTEVSGAFTGEVSASMIKSAGAGAVIIGHSERRLYFKETPDELKRKVKRALEENLIPIFCCGESLEERQSGDFKQIVCDQIKESLFNFSNEDFEKIIVAYEPVWAIGTGLTASPEQAQQMHEEIRSLIRLQYGEKQATRTSILYGGSCNAQNARELFSQKDVDGGLIGGASLKANDFFTIINAF
jgi:triosephosphate isomerase (TIM)